MSVDLDELDQIDLEGEDLDQESSDDNVELTKEGMSFMSKSVLFSITIVIIYTVWTQVAAILWHIEPNDTLTEWVYKFFGLEISLMCLKRIMDKRLKHKKENKK